MHVTFAITIKNIGQRNKWELKKIYLYSLEFTITYMYYLRKPHTGFLRPSFSSSSNSFLRVSFNLRPIPFPTCKIKIKISNSKTNTTIKSLCCLKFNRNECRRSDK